MSKRNWVCFDCRSAVRRESRTAADVPCALCSKPLTNVGYKMRIPAKKDARAWEELRAQWIGDERESWKRRRYERARRVHALEQESRSLETRPANSGRAMAVRRLRKMLKDA